MKTHAAKGGEIIKETFKYMGNVVIAIWQNEKINFMC